MCQWLLKAKTLLLQLRLPAVVLLHEWSYFLKENQIDNKNDEYNSVVCGFHFLDQKWGVLL